MSCVWHETMSATKDKDTTRLKIFFIVNVILTCKFNQNCSIFMNCALNFKNYYIYDGSLKSLFPLFYFLFICIFAANISNKTKTKMNYEVTLYLTDLLNKK